MVLYFDVPREEQVPEVSQSVEFLRQKNLRREAVLIAAMRRGTQPWEDKVEAGRRITVVLVDGHRLIHYAFRFLLGETDDLIFAGSAITREEGLKLARETVPDVAVIEISQAIMDGLLLVQQITREVPSTNIVALSAQDERHVVQKAFDVGAKAYVSKRSHGECLLQAIRAAAEGGLYIDPVIAPAMLPRRGAAISSSAGAGPTLTAREVEVVRLIAQGYIAKEIAGMLGIGDKSVATYKARACQKLGLTRRLELVRYAEAAGWLAAH
jgi:DNA-binding NarL/FixJ family response regulator